MYERGRYGRNPEYVGEVVGATSGGRTIICRIDPEEKSGLCLHPALSSDGTDSWLNRESRGTRSDGVHASCDDYRATLETGEDFGCVHFSPVPSVLQTTVPE